MRIVITSFELGRVTSKPFGSLTTKVKKSVLSQVLKSKGQFELATEVINSRFFRFDVEITQAIDKASSLGLSFPCSNKLEKLKPKNNHEITP